MIVYSHRFSGVLQQMVVDLGLEMTLADDTSPVSLVENETMLSEVAAAAGVTMTRVPGSNGSIQFKFQRQV